MTGGPRARRAPAAPLRSLARRARRAPPALSLLLASSAARALGAQPAAPDTARVGAPAAAPDTAPAAPARAADPFCWRGRPLPRCGAFALFELGGHARLAGTTQRQAQPGGGSYPYRAFSNQLSWQLGAMRNVGARDALGGTLLAGWDDGLLMLGGTARYRRWTSRRTSLEVEAGPVSVAVPNESFGPGGSFRERRTGAVVQARANAADLVSLSGRVIAASNGTRTHVGAFGGVQLGSGAAVGGTAAIGVALAFVAWALASGFQ